VRILREPLADRRSAIERDGRVRRPAHAPLRVATKETPMKRVPILPVLAFLVLGAGQAAADDSQRLANYFVCTLKEGKTPADLIAFKASYEKAVEKAGLKGYELRVQFPMYWSGRSDGVFVWDGSWQDFEAMQKIDDWFRSSEWPAKFQALMTCSESSLWRVVD
jgi:hypothetical protein